MDYKLHRNGRWDILGEKIQLRNAYPAVNGTPVSPVGVSVGEDFLFYELKEGSLKLHFTKKGNEIGITCTAHGLCKAHDIEPVGNAVVEKAEKVFVQGFGMEGPSGCREIGPQMLTSDGLISLYREEGAFFVCAADHRHYINRYGIEKKRNLFGDDVIYLSGGFDLEGTAGNDVVLPPLFFSEEDELAAGLRRCAQKIAAEMGARNEQPPAFHWCSWYYLYQNLSQELLEEYLEGFRREGWTDFRYIQVDAGYAPSLGDWLLPNHLFPEGLKKAAETITRAGYKPGIWIGPFMVGDQSELALHHPDWLLRDTDGNPVTEIESYNEPKVWGNRDSNYYVLDTSHPEALAYLKEVFHTLKEWGFSLFKTDFMFWNMHDTSKVKRFDGSLTSVEILRNTLKTIREAIGEESYLLGCIAPFLPFVGFADGMRIAGDVGAQWAEEYGPLNMIREIVADGYFNHVYWQNDPDSVLLREFEIHLAPHEIQSLALLQALSGGVVTTSDPVHRIAEERAKLLRFIMPKDKVRPCFPYFGQERKDIVLLHRLGQGNLLFAMNPTEEPLTVIYRFGELFGEPEWYVRQYGGGIMEKSEMYADVLKPHDCVLLFLTREPLTREPENLWEW